MMKRYGYILVILLMTALLISGGCRQSPEGTPPVEPTIVSVTPTLTASPAVTLTLLPEDRNVLHTTPQTIDVIIARAEFDADEDGFKAFDALYTEGKTGVDWSKWLDNGGIPTEDDPSWIQVDLNVRVVVDTMAIVSGNDDFGRDPKDFQLLASNDGRNWTMLGQWQEVQFEYRLQAREFKVQNAAQYSKYRLEITRNDGDNPMTQLSEIMLSGPEGGDPVPTATPSPTPTATPIPVQANARIVDTQYPTDDIVVADYDVVTDYGADASGVTDATTAIQQALDDCFLNGGGTIWMPAGTYKITQSVVIKPFCTLRGDWQDPDTGNDYGTVIQADIPTGDMPLFLIGGSAGVMGVTVYYPKQNAADPIEYGWTFEIRGNGDDLGTGRNNDHYHASSVINVTLLNAYKGIGLNAVPFEAAVHELSRVENVRGTVLYRGVDARNCADVGMWRHIHFSNRYWANAPAIYNPPERDVLDIWTRANGTAFTFADVEWDSFYDISAEDYQIGIHFVDGTRIAFAGQFFQVRLTGMDVAIIADADSIDSRKQAWGVSFLRSTFEGSTAAVKNESIGYIHITDSVIDGKVASKYSKRVDVQNPGTSAMGYTEIDAVPKPGVAVLFDVSKAPYTAPVTLGDLPMEDATGAIQQALDDAERAGGGVVYLSAGWYRIDTALTVPGNVELRGSSSVMNRSQSGLSLGTTLFAFQEGAENPALITLDGATSGVRGLRVFYPNNSGVNEVWREYPYAIRINGVVDAYVVNVDIENGYRGINAEAGSDAHYIKNVVGVTTHGFIHVKASAFGWIEDCHSNPNFWMRLDGYGVSPWLEENKVLFAQLKANDVLIQLEDTADEHLMNNFGYAVLHGVQANNADVVIFNIGTDNVGGYTVINEEGSTGTVDVMNSMRYNGAENTINVNSSCNALHL